MPQHLHVQSHAAFPRIFCVNPKLVSGDGGFLGPPSLPPVAKVRCRAGLRRPTACLAERVPESSNVSICVQVGTHSVEGLNNVQWRSHLHGRRFREPMFHSRSTGRLIASILYLRSVKMHGLGRLRNQDKCNWMVSNLNHVEQMATTFFARNHLDNIDGYI